jgi:hypothetical protein
VAKFNVRKVTLIGTIVGDYIKESKEFGKPKGKYRRKVGIYVGKWLFSADLPT